MYRKLYPNEASSVNKLRQIQEYDLSRNDSEVGGDFMMNATHSVDSLIDGSDYKVYKIDQVRQNLLNKHGQLKEGGFATSQQKYHQLPLSSALSATQSARKINNYSSSFKMNTTSLLQNTPDAVAIYKSNYLSQQ